MNIIISNSSGLPIYEQIYRQIKSQIVTGELGEGELLPSIRTLAKDLRISVITTKRAYDELEKDGFVDNVAGKGCYVAETNLEFVREEHLKQIEEHLRAVVPLSAACSLTLEDTVGLLRLIWDENEKDVEE